MQKSTVLQGKMQKSGVMLTILKAHVGAVRSTRTVTKKPVIPTVCEILRSAKNGTFLPLDTN